MKLFAFSSFRNLYSMTYDVKHVFFFIVQELPEYKSHVFHCILFECLTFFIVWINQPAALPCFPLSNIELILLLHDKALYTSRRSDIWKMWFDQHVDLFTWAEDYPWGGVEWYRVIVRGLALYLISFGSLGQSFTLHCPETCTEVFCTGSAYLSYEFHCI